MIHRLLELGTLLMLGGIGLLLVAGFVIGLLKIWRPEFGVISPSENEYRRVESAGAFPQVTSVHSPEYQEVGETSPRPYNWATREPMIWTGPR